MAKCEQGYRCRVCGREVEDLIDSDLYLRFILGQVDAETLHTTPECHVRCNPTLAQFIVAEEFSPAVVVEGDFDKRRLDSGYRERQEAFVTRGWQRLKEVAHGDLPITEYPLGVSPSPDERGLG
jgi:hypothetical protein